MTPQLSPGATKALLGLKKELATFLAEFQKLSASNPEYIKHVANSSAIKILLEKLNQLHLDANEKQSNTVGVAVPDLGKEKTGTKKEDRKARRESRKEARKDKRAEKRTERKDKRAAKKVERKKQKNDSSGSKEEGTFRFDEIKAIWDAFKFDGITDKFRDYLNDAEAFVIKAKNFISYAEAFAQGHFIKEVEEAKELIEKAEKFLAVARNISAQVDRYAKIAQQVVSITLDIPRKLEDLKGSVLTKAQKIFAAAKQFIATADLSDKDLSVNVDTLKGYLTRGQEKLGQLESLVGLATADEDGNNLPDWYDKIEKEYQKILGGKTDLIPGTLIDDKILLQITALKGSIERFVAAASDKVEDLDIQGKIKNLQQWLGELSKFVSAITGFVENIKEGDLLAIYEDLKDFKAFIDSDKDILQGTKIDDKIKSKLKEHSKNAETWLMNKLAGGDPKKEAEVREILGALDKIILSTGGVVDHSSKYEKDEDKIIIPEVTAVSEAEATELLEKYGISKPDASFEGVLSDMKDEADSIMIKVSAKYKESLVRGAMASKAFSDAKEEYDQAVKKHNDYFKATNLLGKKIISGLLGLAVNIFAPGVGSIVSAAVNALLGNFDEVNNKIDSILPKGYGFIGDIAKDILPDILPRWGSEDGNIQLEGKELLQGLNDIYMNGITVRYNEVYQLLNSTKGKASGLGKNLRKVEQADTVDKDGLKAVKNEVLILAKKWEGLQKAVEKQYIELPYPPIDKPKAYQNASRYLYAVWIVYFPQKEIRIADAMIKQFDKFGVLKEANATWNTGGWAKLGRGIFGFFGADPFNHRAELKKMKAWAASEMDSLKTEKAWAGVF